MSVLTLSGIVPRVAHAQLPPGVTCQTVNGVYMCTDAGSNSGSTCITDDDTGQQDCITPGGGTSSSGGTGALGQGLGSVPSAPAQHAGTGWLSKLTGWIAYAIQTVFTALITLLKDLVTFVLGVVLGLIKSAIASIGVPSWLTQYSMGSVLSQAGSTVGFFMSELQIPLALTLIGLGYTFRLLRKFLTLFQW